MGPLSFEPVGWIFDYDGTLAQIPVNWVSARRGFRQLVSDRLDDPQWGSGARMDQMEAEVLEKGLLSAEEVFAYRREVERQADRHEPIELVLALLHEVTLPTGKPHFVISNNLRETVLGGLSQLGLTQKFDAVYGLDSFGRPKPHPAAGQLLQSDWGIEPQTCIFFGDNASTDGRFCAELDIQFIHTDTLD